MVKEYDLSPLTKHLNQLFKSDFCMLKLIFLEDFLKATAACQIRYEWLAKFLNPGIVDSCMLKVA